MADREKVENALYCRSDGFGLDCKDCAYYRENTPAYCNVRQILRDAKSMLKEQDETIKELQNAYGYLQKQFFEVQDKLLKEQEAVVPLTIDDAVSEIMDKHYKRLKDQEGR